MLYLQKAALTDGRDVYEMLQRIPPENGFLNSCYQMAWTDFPAWLAKRINRSQGIGLEDWQVPDTTFWLMDDGVPVAFGSLLRQGPAGADDPGGPADGHHGGAAGDHSPGQHRLPEGGGGQRGRAAPGDGGARVLLVRVTEGRTTWER